MTKLNILLWVKEGCYNFLIPLAVCSVSIRVTGVGVMAESSTGTGTIFIGAGEVCDSLPFRLSFRADNSSQRAFTVL